MLLQVDEFVINTDHIKYITKHQNGSAAFIRIYFGDDFYEKINFPHQEDMERFLDRLGKREYFA